MFDYPENLTDLPLETSAEIWLEAEHFQQAKEVSDRVSSEPEQWQTYLNALAMLGFLEWLKERSSQKICLDLMSATKAVGNLKLGQFKLGALATENLFDEIVYIPEEAIYNPKLAAHFYVVLEVLEEQERVIVRGFLRYDELLNYPIRGSFRDAFCQIPLAKLAMKPDRLLYYCRYLETNSIPLPETPALMTELSQELKATTIKLGRWLDGVFDEAWRAIDLLIDPQANLAFATKSIANSSHEIERGKLINLGSELEKKTFALRVTITKKAEEKISVKVRLDPTGRAKYLPPDLKLIMRSKTGKILQEVVSRTRDNYIQLKPFKGKHGKRFNLEISRENISVKEDFEI